MTRPRWSVRGMLQNTNDGMDPRAARTTNRAFLAGLLVGLVMAVWKFATDDTENTWKMRVAAAVGVLVFVTVFAFLIIDYGMRLFYRVKLRRR